MDALFWTSVGCLIAGFILLIVFFIGQYRAGRDGHCAARFARLRVPLQIGYFVFFIAAAVLWIIY